MNRRNRFFIDLVWIVILITIDQFTKKLAINFLKDGSIPLIPKVLSFTLLEGGNSGAAFGLLKGGFWFFMLTTLIVVLIGLFVLRRMNEAKKYFPLRFATILLLSGAFGNLADRISTKVEMGSSFVVDFIYFEWIDFPIFNVADCYISVSAFLLIVLVLFYYKESDLKQLLVLKREEK